MTDFPLMQQFLLFNRSYMLQWLFGTRCIILYVQIKSRCFRVRADCFNNTVNFLLFMSLWLCFDIVMFMCVKQRGLAKRRAARKTDPAASHRSVASAGKRVQQKAPDPQAMMRVILSELQVQN